MWRQRGSIAVVPFSDHGMSDQRSVDRAGKSSRVQIDCHRILIVRRSNRKAASNGHTSIVGAYGPPDLRPFAPAR